MVEICMYRTVLFLIHTKKNESTSKFEFFFPIPNLVILFSYIEKVLLLFKTNTDKLVFGQ